MANSFTGGVTKNDNLDNRDYKILTYGALILPFDIDLSKEENKPDTDPKENTKQEGKIKSAFKRAGESKFGKAVKSSKAVKTLTEYMKDKRNIDKLKNAFGIVGDKFSGIAVCQAIIDGRVSSQEALDYLFMGFAPALGVEGALMGYSGLNQMRDALFNGDIDVGAFISGFRRTLKGIVDLKDMVTKDNTQKSANVLEFDLTLSHSETYQSETPDRRVQSGQSLNEYVHNMPVTFEVQCALQEGKRYSKEEFRSILESVRKSKMVVSLVLGDEMFENLVLTNFNPNHDCSKSGMDYTLSFKQILWGYIDTNKEVHIQMQPPTLESDESKTTTYGGLGGSGNGSGSTKMPDVKVPSVMDAVSGSVNEFIDAVKSGKGSSVLKAIGKHL